MAAVEKCVLDNPFRATLAKEDTLSPSPCVNGARFNASTDRGRAGRGGRGQHRPGQRGPKRPFPDACDFYCDSCEQGFADHAELANHYSEHVPCPRDGCDFAASPTLVSLHEKLQHDNPLIRRCANVAVTIEDVEEWRRQRRLRYPTLRNIEAKKAAEAEQQMRREVLKEDSKRRRFKKRRHGRRNASASNRAPQQQPPPPPLPPPPPPAIEASPREASPVKPSPNEPDQITDSESDVEQKASAPAPPSPPAVSSALASLMACYNSDSDDETPVEIPQAVPSAVVTDQASPNEVATPATPIETTPVNSTQPPPPTRTTDKAPPRQKPTYRPPPRRLTLLQKLLASEVRHERNVILQCAHHVVENDFFGESGPKSDERG